MRNAVLTSALVVLLAAISAAQDTLKTVSSAPLPADLQGKLGAIHVRMGCGDDGSITIPLAHPITEAADPIVRLGADGSAQARINVDRVAGLEKALVADFAPGPNGETCVLAYKVLLEKIGRMEDGEVRSIGRKLDPQPTLLRFDSKGDLIDSHHLEQLQKYGGPYKLAVFDTGDILLLDTGPGNRNPDALVLSPEGKILKTISLAGSALDESIDTRAELREFHYLPVTVISSRDTVFLVGGEELPSVAVVSSKGEVLYSAKLKVPVGYWIVTPRVSGEHVFAELEPAPKSGAQRSTREYGEFDSHSGVLLTRHPVPSFAWTVACPTSNGLGFFHIEEGANSLEVVRFTPTE